MGDNNQKYKKVSSKQVYYKNIFNRYKHIKKILFFILNIKRLSPFFISSKTTYLLIISMVPAIIF